MPTQLPCFDRQIAPTESPDHSSPDTVPSFQAPYTTSTNATPPLMQQPDPLPLPPPSLTSSPTRHQHCCLSLSSTLLEHLTSCLFAFPPDAALQCGAPSHDHGRGIGERQEAEVSTTSTSTSTTRTRTTVLLSIGSGSGLLEAFLLRHVRGIATGCDVQVYGVEVPGGGDSTGLNRYLPPERRIVVDGSWDVLDRNGLDKLLLERDLHGLGANRAGLDGDGDVVLMFVYPRLPSLVKRYLDVWIGDRGRLGAIVWAGPRADWEDYRDIFEGLKVQDWDLSMGWGVDVGVGEGEGVAVARR